MAATQVAHTTIMFDRWWSFFSFSSLSVISSWSSQGSLVNSSTSTSYRNLTLDDSRRQKRWPESRRSRHHIGSCGGMAEIVIVSMKLQNRDCSIKVRLLQNRAIFVLFFVIASWIFFESSQNFLTVTRSFVAYIWFESTFVVAAIDYKLLFCLLFSANNHAKGVQSTTH